MDRPWLLIERDMKMNEKLKELAKENDIIYTVLAKVDSNEVEIFGNKGKLEYTSLIDKLFGDRESIKNLNQSLEGQIMPRIWKQGKVNGIVCKPDVDTLIGLFYHEERDVVASFKFSKNINSSINKLWGTDN